MKIRRFAMTAMIVLAASCSKDYKGSSEGSVRFSIASSDELAEVTKGSVSSYTSIPSAASFTIQIKDSDNASVWSGLVSEWDNDMKMNLGSYTVAASYGAEGDEGFDKPWFTGTASFSVTGGHTDVNIPVALGNSLVKVRCTDAFNNYFPQHSFTVTTGVGTVIDFPADEERAAFVDAFRFSIGGTLVNQAGTSVTVNPVEYTNLEPKTCYTVSFDASNIGGLSVTVSFNDVVETVSLGNVELND